MGKLAGFQGVQWSGEIITERQIVAWELLLAIPSGATNQQMATFSAAIANVQGWAAPTFPQQSIQITTRMIP